MLLDLTTSFYGLLLGYRVVRTTHVSFRLSTIIMANNFLSEIQKVVNLSNGNELQLPPIFFKKSAFLRLVTKQFANTALSRTQTHLILLQQGKNGSRMWFCPTKREIMTSDDDDDDDDDELLLCYGWLTKDI